MRNVRFGLARSGRGGRGWVDPRRSPGRRERQERVDSRRLALPDKWPSCATERTGTTTPERRVWFPAAHSPPTPPDRRDTSRPACSRAPRDAARDCKWPQCARHILPRGDQGRGRPSVVIEPARQIGHDRREHACRTKQPDQQQVAQVE